LINSSRVKSRNAARTWVESVGCVVPIMHPHRRCATWNAGTSAPRGEFGNFRSDPGTSRHLTISEGMIDFSTMSSVSVADRSRAHVPPAVPEGDTSLQAWATGFGTVELGLRRRPRRLGYQVVEVNRPDRRAPHRKASPMHASPAAARSRASGRQSARVHECHCSPCSLTAVLKAGHEGHSTPLRQLDAEIPRPGRHLRVLVGQAAPELMTVKGLVPVRSRIRSSRPATILDGLGLNLRRRTHAEPHRSPHRRARPATTVSTEEATGKPIARSYMPRPRGVVAARNCSRF
jgi:hypothetical protein